jgi:hypothetical protein
MKKIKSFSHFSDSHSVSRLFESGKDRLESRIAEISDVYEDVKSLEYILEEGDYDYEWKISTEHNSYNINDNISDLIRGYSFPGDGSVFHHDFLKPVKIRINILGIGGKLFNEVTIVGTSTTVDKIKDGMSRFKTLLEQHLDYLPEGSVTLYDAGWIGNYKINIKIP